MLSNHEERERGRLDQIRENAMTLSLSNSILQKTPIENDFMNDITQLVMGIVGTTPE